MPNENDNKNSSSSQETPRERNLMDELKTVTAVKKPTSNKTPGWNFSDDEVKQETPPADTATETPAAEGPKPVGKFTEKELEMSAEASAAGVEFFTSLLSESIICLRYHFKFTSEERDELNDVILDMPEGKRNDEQQTKANKYNRLMDRMQEKIKSVKMSEPTRRRLAHAFKKHAELTGELPMSPKMMRNLAIGEAVIKSCFHSFMD